jgi:alkanesulfonate monooxygenase SsuD/methylene tetrahydromethanopterin reductase-like flavin-dependent oxidoreductase (luciferase family)
MRVGIVILPEYRWWIARPKWEAVEEYGFDHAWTYDHIGWDPLLTEPWFGAVPTLAAAAGATSRIQLGTFVASPNFRHPVSFVRDVTALDDVSDGRLLLGIGAGGSGHDSRVLGGDGLSAKARVDRFTEFLQLLDKLLSQPRTSWTGEYYTAVDAGSSPGSVRRPRVPFLVAANGRRSLGLVARFGDGWITTGQNVDDLALWWTGVARLAQQLDEELMALGRHPESVSRYLSLDSSPRYSLSSVGLFTDMVARAGELGFTDVVAHWPRSDGVYAGHESVLEAIAAEALPTIQRRSVT